MLSTKNYKMLSIFQHLRFPLSLMVVFIHSVGTILTDDLSWDVTWNNGYGFYNIFRSTFSQGLSLLAVPTFFFMSGYLYFHNVNSFNIQVYLSKEKRRLKSLLLPYILWNLIYILHVVVGRSIKCFITSQPYSHVQDFFFENGGLSLFWDSYGGGSPIDFPLWFVRDLFIMGLFSPVIYVVINKIGYYSLFIVFFFLFAPSFGWQSVPGFDWSGVAFFVLGCTLSICKLDILSVLMRKRFLIYSLSILLLILTIYNWGSITFWGALTTPSYTFIGCFGLFLACHEVINRYQASLPKILTDSVFFIFASHMLVKFYCGSLFKPILNDDNYWLVTIGYLFNPIFAVCVCIVLFWVLSKFLPQAAKVLSGGR